MMNDIYKYSPSLKAYTQLLEAKIAAGGKIWDYFIVVGVFQICDFTVRLLISRQIFLIDLLLFLISIVFLSPKLLSIVLARVQYKNAYKFLHQEREFSWDKEGILMKTIFLESRCSWKFFNDYSVHNGLLILNGPGFYSFHIRKTAVSVQAWNKLLKLVKDQIKPKQTTKIKYVIYGIILWLGVTALSGTFTFGS